MIPKTVGAAAVGVATGGSVGCGNYGLEYSNMLEGVADTADQDQSCHRTFAKFQCLEKTPTVLPALKSSRIFVDSCDQDPDPGAACELEEVAEHAYLVVSMSAYSLNTIGGGASTQL